MAIPLDAKFEKRKGRERIGKKEVPEKELVAAAFVVLFRNELVFGKRL